MASLKLNVEELDIHKLNNAPTNASNLVSTVDEVDVDKLVPVPVVISKLSDAVKIDVI